MAKQKYEKVLITGASSGIGREMALWWARRGATVWAGARRQSNLEELAKQGEGRIKPISLDVSKHAQLVENIQKLDDDEGGLDLVIANAGIGDPTPAHLATWEMVDRVIATNAGGMAATVTAVLPRMVKRGRGHIVAVSSISAYFGLGAYSGYCGTKAFVSTFMQSLQVDLHGTGVKALIVEPGFVKSEMQAKIEELMTIPFVMETPKAAELIGKAVLTGKRSIAFPSTHAWTAKLLRWVPKFIYDPLAKRSSASQVLLAERYLNSLPK